MWLMLQAASADDYVVATGNTHSVGDLCSLAFAHLGLDYRDYVRRDPESYRPDEKRQLVGDPSKATRELGWRPEMDFPELVQMMVDADLERLPDRH
jgi:GDPmannose 4,6-dehydratase